MDAFEKIATRQINARNSLVNCLAEIGAITVEQAEKVATLYLGREVRGVKLDAVGGSFVVKHGALMERSAINTAVAMIAAGQFKTVR